MFNFLKRFLFAWKLAKNPEVLKLVLSEMKFRENEAQIRSQLCATAKAAVAGLIPEDRYAASKALDVEIQIEHTELLTPEEADQILEESRIENKVILPNLGSTKLGQEAAMDEHLERCQKGFSDS